MFSDDSTSIPQALSSEAYCSLKAWSEVPFMDDMPLLSLDTVSRIETSEQANQTEINQQLHFPPELLEKIVCYLDGKTLLQFRLLSKSCYSVVNNVLRFNKLWKKICLKEIPKKYLVDMVSKYFVTHTSLDSLSNVQYEHLYKNWVQWQSTVFNVKCIGEEHFLGLNEINSIICNKSDVMVVFSNCTSLLSLNKNKKTKRWAIVKKGIRPLRSNKLLALNPYQHCTVDGLPLAPYITCYYRQENKCPLHTIPGVSNNEIYCSDADSKLIDVDFNRHVNLCCWVQKEHFDLHLNSETSSFSCVHMCKNLTNTMFTSLTQGIIISRVHINGILYHNIYNNVCEAVRPWLDNKYTGATAVYIYTDILFIGTQTGYLLAYRLRCWDDFQTPLKTNILFEIKLDIGQIVKLDVMNFNNFRAIIVASTSSVLWIKIN